MTIMAHRSSLSLLSLLLLICSTCTTIAASKDDNDIILSSKDRIRNAVFGALVADAMCMGSHLQYNTTRIAASFNESIQYPPKIRGKATHPRTVPGDLTDYGEYNVFFLEHLASIAPAPLTVSDELVAQWKKRIFTWNQRHDKDSQYALRQLMHGFHQSSAEFGSNTNVMAIRTLGLLGYTAMEKQLVQYAKVALFTNIASEGLAGQEFMTRIAFRLVHPVDEGMSLLSVVESVADDMDHDWIHKMLDHALEKVREVQNPKTKLGQLAVESSESNDNDDEYTVDDLAICTMGKTYNGKKVTEYMQEGKDSAAENTLPAALYFIFKYEKEADLINVFQSNAKVGGDNGGRAIAIGMVLGALSSTAKIPNEWRTELNHYQHVTDLLAQLPLLREKEESSSSSSDEL